jgi:hypothetical protein
MSIPERQLDIADWGRTFNRGSVMVVEGIEVAIVSQQRSGLSLVRRRREGREIRHFDDGSRTGTGPYVGIKAIVYGGGIALVGGGRLWCSRITSFFGGVTHPSHPYISHLSEEMVTRWP